MLLRVPASGPVAMVRGAPEATARIASPRRRKEHRILAATAALALGVPFGASLWLRSRTHDLASTLGTAGGVTARIGGVDADLTGTIRIERLELGDILAADAIEASVGMGSLLGGHLRADEIRVDSPHVAIRIDADGDSDLARLARKLLGRGNPVSASGSRGGGVRRIVVAGGTLTAHVVGVGDITADGVELVPDTNGARVITGPVRLVSSSRLGPRLELAFSRSAAEVALPSLHFGRVLAVGGRGQISTGRDHALALQNVAAGRRSASAPLELRGAVDDGGVARPLELDLARHDGSLAIVLRGERIPLGALASLAPEGLELEGARATGTLAVVLPAPPPQPQPVTLTLDPLAPTKACVQTASCAPRPIARSGKLAVSAVGSVEDLAIDHPLFAPGKVTLSTGAHADLAITNDAITIARGGVTLGAIEVSVAGWASRGTLRSGTLELALAPAPCDALLASLPEPIRGPLDAMTLTGSVGGRLRLVVDLGAPAGEGTTLVSLLDGGCTASGEPPAADVTVLAGASEQQLADGSRVRIGKGEAGWTALRPLPSHVSGAFVSAEDGRFWSHAGFDLEQIARSLEIDLREHRLARGGSTISQQLIKNAFLSQRRSFDRKLQEAILTWRLEARLDKRQILERYLNIIELGPRVFGIGAAARYWFDREASDLTIRQAAFLAALTSQPTSMSRRIRRAGGLDPESAERVAVILRAMRRDGVIGKDAHADAKAAPLDFAKTAIE
jgi:hypothetical protein